MHARAVFKFSSKKKSFLAEFTVTDRERENKTQIDFDEKHQSQFNVVQAELANQFALLQSEREKMKQDSNNITSSKGKEVEILKQRLLETQKALDKVRT